MKIVFIGCVTFSRYALKALLDQQAQIVGVFTIDETLCSQVSDFATFDDLVEGKNIPIFKGRDIHDPEAIQKLNSLQPDLIYVIGWSWMIKKEVLEIPKKALIGLHPTLLPQGRGRAPIPWTILKGLSKSGVTLFYLTEKPDAGNIIKQDVFNIDQGETATTLYQKVCNSTYTLVSKTVSSIAAGQEETIKQDETKATYWTKRKPEDGKICWEETTCSIDTLIRAVTHPYPGAFSFCDGKKVFIWGARPVTMDQQGVPGEVVDFQGEHPVVKTSDGALLLHSVQFENFSGTLKNGDRFCA